MRLFQGIFVVLVALLALMGGVFATPRSTSVHFCTKCRFESSSEEWRWYYDVRVVVRDCYNNIANGMAGPARNRCPGGDFSLTIDKSKDIRAKFVIKDANLHVKYGGKTRVYSTSTPNRVYGEAGRSCFEWYDEYEPSKCNL